MAAPTQMPWAMRLLVTLQKLAVDHARICVSTAQAVATELTRHTVRKPRDRVFWTSVDARRLRVG